MREMGGASLQDNSVRVKSLADTVTSLAVAQIKSATLPPQGVESFTWTSQPGMIVTYDEGGFRKGHKLYSSAKSIIDTQQDLSEDAQVLVLWRSFPERFIDLNAPDVRYGSGETVETVAFPILDPRAQWIDEVEGFTIDLANTPGGKSEDVAAGLALPMPVEWIYMLDDGSMGTLGASGKYAGSGTPTRDNPIVARFGYWIDDETSKVNINVASEAAPWDIPRSASTAAIKRGERQPAFNELYRYAGHPATTCLSSVFFPGAYADDDSREAPDTRTLDLTELQSIYELAPKVAFGGSRAGSQIVDSAVVLDNDRLYPSIDELIFRVTRGKQSVFTGSNIDTGKLARTRGFLTARSRAPEVNIHGAPRIAMWPVDEDPAVGVHRSAYDATMNFCSTLNSDSGGQQHFIVRRENPGEPATELYSTSAQGNAKLLNYLLAQTNQPIPSYGSSLGQKYGSPGGSAAKLPASRPETTGILENAFAPVTSDYYRDHTRIALQMLDYIRGVNLHDASVAEPYADPFRSETSFGQVSPWVFSDPDLSSESPKKLDWHEYEKYPFPKGYGRHYTISEMAMVIFCSAEGRLKTSGKRLRVRADGDPFDVLQMGDGNGSVPEFENLSGNGGDRYQLHTHPMAYDPDNEGRWLRYLQVALLPEIFSPMQGFHQIHPKLALRMVTNASEGYKGAWGTAPEGTYHDPSAERHLRNVPAGLTNAYPDWSGYSIQDDVTKFKNPISYWGNFSKVGSQEVTNDPQGPILQTIDLGLRSPDEYRGDLPKGWFGWGGSGGYRIMRFGSEAVEAHNYFPDAERRQRFQGSNRYHTELTNGRSTISPFYAQKPVVVSAGRASSRRSGGQNHTFSLVSPGKPIQFLLYSELDNDIETPGENLLQVIEMEFPTITNIAVPNLPSGDDWDGWGRRLNRSAENTAVPTQPLGASRTDVLNDTDVVLSMIPRHSDFRHVAGRSFVPAELWKIHPKADNSLNEEILAAEDSRLGFKAHSLMHSNPVGSAERPADRPAEEVSEGITGALGATFLDDYSDPPRSLTFADYGTDPDTGYQPDFSFDPSSPTFLPTAMVENRRGLASVTYDPVFTRDFDNGVGNARDGAYTNKPDDGADPLRKEESGFGNIPYFNVDKASEFDYRSRFDKGQVDNTFSPNQMVPSPVMFGSLPNAMQANIPWSTLLFRPDLEDKDSARRHLGNAGIGLDEDFSVIRDRTLPAEHLWLDLFWMPVVDPFPISEPLSTMGKVNMNYQMLPFTYIDRATAMHAVLKGERILAIPEEDSTNYKRAGASDGDHYFKIDATTTLKQFQEKFDNHETFVTASEITEQFLYPAGEDTPDYQEDGSSIRNWWASHPQTGDNSLERPYANLYSKLTTQSNTFTVHSTVQVLSKARSTAPDTWEEGKDRVLATYRGSALIERYIDPEKNDFPQFLGFDVDAASMPRLESLYAYRILNTKEFTP